MKYTYSTLAVLALYGFAQAQIPACATNCISKAVSSASTCSETDVACQCTATNQAAIGNAALSCVIGSCGQTEAVAVLSAVQAACAAVSAAPAAPATVVAPVPAPSISPSSTSSVAAPTTPTSTSSSAGGTTTVSPSSSASGNSSVTSANPPLMLANDAGVNIAGAASLAVAAGMVIFAVL